jgi:hypothetical protein
VLQNLRLKAGGGLQCHIIGEDNCENVLAKLGVGAGGVVKEQGIIIVFSGGGVAILLGGSANWDTLFFALLN